MSCPTGGGGPKGENMQSENCPGAPQEPSFPGNRGVGKEGTQADQKQESGGGSGLKTYKQLSPHPNSLHSSEALVES